MVENEVIIIKLVTGEVVIGKYLHGEEEVVLEKPFSLIMDPMQGGVGLMPYNAIYTQTEPESATFQAKYIVEEIQVHSSFKDAYLERVTGIETKLPEIEV